MNEITVGELIQELQKHDPECLVSFSGLSFLRLKSRSDTVVQLEFEQVVYRDSEGTLVAHDLQE